MFGPAVVLLFNTAKRYPLSAIYHLFTCVFCLYWQSMQV